MHDGIAFEKRGIPSATIISSEFVQPARTMARLLRMPDYRVAVVPHPIASLNEDATRQRADVALPQVLDILLTQ